MSDSETSKPLLGQAFVDKATAADAPDGPDVIGPSPSLPSRLRWWRYNMAFYWKRLRVCFLSLWYLHHWPWGDLSTAEWRFQLAGETAWSAFLEGWCRD